MTQPRTEPLAQPGPDPGSDPTLEAAAPTVPEPSPALLAVYQLAVEMADRVSARRGVANAFFLTIQTALLAAIELSTAGLRSVPWWAQLAVASTGVVLSGTWWLQLRTYRDLNTAKFDVINAIEPLLPAAPFTDEWALLQRSRAAGRPRRTHYLELGFSERLVPVLFAALHLILLLGRMLS